MVADSLELSGKILANGAYKRYHGTGSGGSIWLQVGTLAGDAGTTARIQANGGTGSQSFYGGGSGGRIAIYYAAAENFNLETQVSAKGAKYGSNIGGAAGTIYLKDTVSGTDQLRVDNSGIGLTNVSYTLLEEVLPSQVVVKGARVEQLIKQR